MLRISNLDDRKSEWSNPTHIVLPLVDGDILSKEPDKMTAGTITLNALDGADQTVLTNGLEHSLVIGLDRNLFETNNKSDLLVIQNPELKLLQCNSDLKNSVTYTLSYVDQDRSEILWESSVLKDKTKPEWCSADKAVFEVKDVLNYDDSVQESSKNWHDDLEKTNDEMSLDDVGGDLSQITKPDGSILIQVEEAINGGKKIDLGRDTHYIVNYFPAVQNCESISVLSNSVENTVKQKSIILRNNSLISNEVPQTIKESDSNKQNILHIPEEEFTESAEVVNITKIEADVTGNHVKNKQLNLQEGKAVRTSSSLPEKSLPLKKKAKMKRTMVPGIEYRTKQDDPVFTQQENICLNERTTTQQSNDNTQQNFSDSDEPLSDKIDKQKKKIKPKLKPVSTFLVQSEHKPNEHRTDEMQQNSEDEITRTKNRSLEFDEKKLDSIFGLVNELKKCRMINATVWETLCSGLKEMKVDILKEMNSKRKEASGATDGTSYSVQLKAFALILYFKQPAAFNYLAKLYGTGWPSLPVIKDWKRRLNSHSRPNFVGVDKESEIETSNKVI